MTGSQKKRKLDTTVYVALLAIFITLAVQFIGLIWHAGKVDAKVNQATEWINDNKTLPLEDERLQGQINVLIEKLSGLNSRLDNVTIRFDRFFNMRAGITNETDRDYLASQPDTG